MIKILNFINFIYKFAFIVFFNILIFLKIIPEEYIEKMLTQIIEEFLFNPMILIADDLKSDPENKEKLDKLFETRSFILKYSEKIASAIIWNDVLCAKLTGKILKEKFRKLTWDLRCAGFSFSLEV